MVIYAFMTAHSQLQLIQLLQHRYCFLELRFNADAAPSAVDGVLTFNAITQDSNANNTGTASWFRALKSDGSTVLFDGTVGVSGSDLNIATTAIVAGRLLA